MSRDLAILFASLSKHHAPLRAARKKQGMPLNERELLKLDELEGKTRRAAPAQSTKGPRLPNTEARS